MNQFLIQYIFPAAVSLLLFYAIFGLLLRKETYFGFNRIYLLAAMIFSCLLPFIRFPQETRIADLPALPVVYAELIEIETMPTSAFSIGDFLFYIYLAGVLFFILRLLTGLFRIFYLIQRYKITDYKGSKVVFLKNNMSHFSFFRLIFINQSRLNESHEAVILNHEKEHQRQLHGLDLILLEILTVFQWFNPIIWFYRRSLKSIHEYQADRSVIEHGCKKTDYLNLIFEQVSDFHPSVFINKFNLFNLKKRIIMMNKKKSLNWTKSKALLMIPVAMMLMFFFGFQGNSANQLQETALLFLEKTTQPEASAPMPDSTKKEQKAEDEVFIIVDQKPKYPGGDEARLKFLRENIKYPADAIEEGKSGTAYVHFIVEKDGSISNIKVANGVSKSIDEECIRVMKSMPKWIPGMLKGKVVRVHYQMPIIFSLAEKEE